MKVTDSTSSELYDPKTRWLSHKLPSSRLSALRLSFILAHVLTCGGIYQLGTIEESSAESPCMRYAIELAALQDRPCLFNPSGQVAQQISVPPKLNFQARVSQSGILLGDREIGQYSVKIYDIKQQLLCGYDGSNLRVRKSTINLQAEQNDLGCHLGELIATHGDLALKVCFDGSNCLRPLKLSTVPYAYKSEYTYWALNSEHAERSSISNIALWVTADRDLTQTVQREINNNADAGALTQNISGRFDFRSLNLASTSGRGGLTVPFERREASAGLISWAPNPVITDRQRSMHLVGKDIERDTLKPLDQAVVVSERLHVGGDLTLAGDVPPTTSSDTIPRARGLTVTRGDVALRDQTQVAGKLTTRGDALSSDHVESILPVIEDRAVLTEDSQAGLPAQFSVFVGENLDDQRERFTLNSGLLEITGRLSLGDDLNLSQNLNLERASFIQGRLSVSQALRVSGLLGLRSVPATSAQRPISATHLTIGEALTLSAGDLTIEGEAGMRARGLAELRSPLSVYTFGSSESPGFTTSSLTLRLLTADRVRSSQVIKAQGNTLEVGQLGESMRFYGVTRIEGAVEFEQPDELRNTGSCKLEVPADEEAKLQADNAYKVERYELACGTARVPIRTFLCGDGKYSSGEQCDDGNLQNGDGCSSHCLCEPENLIDGVYFKPKPGETVLVACAGDRCGDEIINVGEECDDGSPQVITQANSDDLDTCELCRTRRCGNGIISVNEYGEEEQCDNGDTEDNDGCDSRCQLENDPPRVVNEEEVNVNEDDAVESGQLNAVDNDEDDILTYSVAPPVPGFTLNEDGSWDFDPSDDAYQSLAEGQEDTVTVNYTVTDRLDLSADGVLTIVVTGINDAPTLNQFDNVTVSAAAANPSDSVTADDIDTGERDELTYDFTAVVAGNNQNNIGFSHNLATWTLDLDQARYRSLKDGESEVITVTYSVTDNQGASSVEKIFTLTVTGVNDAPIATFTAEQNVTEDDAVLSGELTSEDDDPGDTATFSLDAPVDGLTLSGANNATWTFDPAHAAYQDLDAGDTLRVAVDYTVTDGSGGVGNGSFNIIVAGANDEPVATFITPLAIKEDDAAATDTLTATDVDADDVLTFSLDDVTAGLTLAGADWTFDPSDDAYQALEKGETQSVIVTYTVTDSHDAEDSKSFEIMVTGINDAPVATFNTRQDVNEGSGAHTGELTSTDVDNNATATFADTTDGVAGLTINADGSFSFDTNDATYDVLDKDDTLTVNVTYSVTDEYDAVGNNEFDIVITGTNDAPVATFNAQQTATEDGQAVNGSLTFTDVDADDTALFAHTNAPIAGFSLDVNTGAWTFDPTDTAYQHIEEGQTETVSIQYSVTDSQGAVDATQSFDIVVNGTNDAPVANFTGEFEIIEDDGAGLTGTLTSTDVDDNATATFALVTPPAGVSLTGADWSFNATDEAYQELAVGEEREIKVNYKVIDDKGEEDTNSFTITVTGVNDAPVLAAIDNVSFNKNEAAPTGDLSATDAEMDDLIYSCTAVYAQNDADEGDPVAGLTVNNDTDKWTLDLDPYQGLTPAESRQIDVTCKANDGITDSDDVSFTITVTGVS